MLSIQTQYEILQIKKTLQEDEKRFEHFLELLEKWIDCHAFIPKNYNKQMIPIFLRNCKYNLDKTKQKLELYFIYKNRYPEVFGYHEFSDEEKRASNNFYVFDASKLTPDGYRVNCFGFRSPDPNGIDMNVVNKLLAMYATYKANHDVINGGIIVIVNFQNLSPSIASGFINPFFKRLLGMVQTIYPFRIGGIYMTFVPKFSVPIANTIKMLFNEKIRSKFHVEAGNDYMKKHIPMYCIPEEWGGTDGTINKNASKFIQEIALLKPWFLEQEKIQIVGDIPRNLYEASGIDENVGTQGSFRTLNID